MPHDPTIARLPPTELKLLYRVTFGKRILGDFYSTAQPLWKIAFCSCRLYYLYWIYHEHAEFWIYLKLCFVFSIDWKYTFPGNSSLFRPWELSELLRLLISYFYKSPEFKVEGKNTDINKPDDDYLQSTVILRLINIILLLLYLANWGTFETLKLCWLENQSFFFVSYLQG